MKLIHAVSLAPDVNGWLTISCHPRILHVFAHACNLINENGEVLSIVTTRIGNGPFNLVLEEELCFRDYVNLESSVFISPVQITLGSLIINTENAKLWNPQPSWEGLYINRVYIADQVTKPKQMRGLDTDFAFSQPYSTTGFDSKLLITNYQFSNSLVSNLASALAHADLPSAVNAARTLAGLGIGLTPSGDDLIMGAIYAVWIIHPFDVASVIAQEIANTAAPLTTSLSAAWLKSAGKGEAGILWHAFFEAVVSGNLSRIQETMEDILAVGETSGADALVGFADVFVAWMEKAGSSHG